MSDRTLQSGMILCAGLGTRMRPLTLERPKPLIEVAGRTMADRALDRLKDADIEHAVLNISYLGDQIKTHFQDRADLSIDFSEEETPLETGGGVSKALPLLKGEAFYVMNGDAVLLNGPSPALSRMAKKWALHDVDVLLLLQPTTKAVGYDGLGDFRLAPDGQLSFRGTEATAPYVFTGIQILSKKLFQQRAESSWSLREIYEQAIENNRAMGIVHDGEWLHIGTPGGLKEAESFFERIALQ